MQSDLHVGWFIGTLSIGVSVWLPSLPSTSISSSPLSVAGGGCIAMHLMKVLY
jgi:hypothetical protein